MMIFSNSYSRLPERFFERVNPEHFPAPKLLILNTDLLSELEINVAGISNDELALIFSGQKLLPGSEPIATVYAAHQFGHFVPRLGDGRAHLIGEVNGFDIQLKGSGRTSFSRNGDGRSALGPVIREYLVSEFMFRVGVPTTRALAAVLTGETVYRHEQEPGGILTRVAPSHVRVGTFQYFACNTDIDGVKKLLDYSINRHYPELESIEDLSTKALSFIQSVGDAQAKLISKWMSLGFIHGVMNTDNYSVGGFTIDYGPCAFMDEYKKSKVFSSIDRNQRYSYQNQLYIAQWNLLRLADCLLPLIDSDTKKAVAQVESLMPIIIEKFEKEYLDAMAAKFGIIDVVETDQALVDLFLEYMQEEEVDFTLGFRNLPYLFDGDTSYYPETEKLKKFLKIWKQRVGDVSKLNFINPLYIPRNHQIERAISEANKGDYKVLNELKEVLLTPYTENKIYAKYAIAPEKNERVTATFCGT